MAHYCYVCKEVFTDADGVAFYNFPKDPAWRKVWEKQIRRENLPHYAEICSMHFTPDCFFTNFSGKKFYKYLKPNALPTLIDDPTPQETKTKVDLGPSEFLNRNRIHRRRVVPAASAVTNVAQGQDVTNTKEKIESLQEERASLKRKIAEHTKYLEELKKLRFFDTDSSALRRKRLLPPDPEEERSIRKRPNTSKPSMTATQLESGTPSTLVENIWIKEEPEEADLVILSKTSKPSASATQFESGTVTLIDNIKKKEVPDEEDITIALESVLEVENAKIKTEPLSDSEQELPYIAQEYRSAIIRKCPGPFDDAILGFPQESRCGVSQKCSDPSDDAMLVLRESRCGVAQRCSDPSDDAINVVQQCPDKSDDGLLVPQESGCDVVQKCSDPSDDAILGVPVEYLPISCQDVSDKLEHNQLSASGSATSDHIPFMPHNDQATTLRNAPTLISMELVPIAIPISENLPDVNPVSENLSNESSTSESLSDENSMSKSLFDENSMSENLSDENSMSKGRFGENSMWKNQSDKNSCSCNREKDEFDLFGEFVASKLRRMTRKKATQIQTKFGDLLFKFESGELNIHSANIWLNNVQFQ